MSLPTAKRRIGMLPSPRIMDPLCCPHCRTNVDARASVCAGCGAKIVRGASRNERTTAGCLFSLVGLVMSLFIVGVLPLSSSNYGQGVAVVLGLYLSVVLFNAAGRGVAKWVFRSKLSFFRNYRHQ